MRSWMSYVIGQDKEPAELKCINSYSGVSIGKTYLSWEFDGTYYRIWNDCENPVRVPAGVFSLEYQGDILTTFE